jgi:hypothetical protein
MLGAGKIGNILPVEKMLPIGKMHILDQQLQTTPAS